MKRITHKEQSNTDKFMKCTVVNENGETTEELLHESEIALLEMLDQFSKQMHIQPPVMNLMYNKIQDYTAYCVNVQSTL